MAALGNYLVNVLTLVVVGVIVYSICIATEYKAVGDLAKLLTVVLVVALTFETVAKPMQKLSKDYKQINNTVQQINDKNSLLHNVIWFGAAPEQKTPEAVALPPQK